MMHIILHFQWVRISPSVQQMLAHNWDLFQMQEGAPIGFWSDISLASRDKHIRNFRSGAGCRARHRHDTVSIKNNINDIFVRMLITSAPAVAFVRRNMLVSRQQSTKTYYVPNCEEAMVYDMFV